MALLKTQVSFSNRSCSMVTESNELMTLLNSLILKAVRLSDVVSRWEKYEFGIEKPRRKRHSCNSKGSSYRFYTCTNIRYKATQKIERITPLCYLPLL